MPPSRSSLLASSHIEANQSQHTSSHGRETADPAESDRSSTSHSASLDGDSEDDSDECSQADMGGAHVIGGSTRTNLMGFQGFFTDTDATMTNTLSGSNEEDTWHEEDEDMSDTDDGGAAILDYTLSTNVEGLPITDLPLESGHYGPSIHDMLLSSGAQLGFTMDQVIDDDEIDDFNNLHTGGTPDEEEQHEPEEPPNTGFSSMSSAEPFPEEDLPGYLNPQLYQIVPLPPPPMPSAPHYLETPFLPLGYLAQDPGEPSENPFAPSTIAPIVIGPDNLSLFEFIRYWAMYGSGRSPGELQVTDLPTIDRQSSLSKDEVRYDDLAGDECDVQGIDWNKMGTTRETARIRRRATYNNYVNRAGTDVWNPTLPDKEIPQTDSFFRFKKMIIRRDVSLAHFQLRSVLACPSRSQIFYTSPKGISRLNPFTKKTETVLDLNETAGFGRAITALDAKYDVLVGGTFNGDVCVTSLHHSSKKSPATLIEGFDGIANHVQIHTQRRSSSPVVSVSCNDSAVRILDLQSEEFILESGYGHALNATAVSPDRRLRMLVGDAPNAIVADAETGEQLVELTGHRDNGFACDWSDDGVTVATGYQDKSIKIWDARRWTNSNGEGTPVASIWSEMSGARNLRFSPLGSGAPVLVATEEADYVNIIDAKTFSSKQTFDVIGELGGLAFTDDGHELNVAVSDWHRGGLVQLERCRTSVNDGRPFMLESIEAF